MDERNNALNLEIQNLSGTKVISIYDSQSSKLNPKFRHFFYKGEKLLAEEDETIEYKNYKMPLDMKYDSSIAHDKHTQELIEQLKKQYCGFLNKKGGRIYIGINDEKIVLGVHLNAKDRDKTRNDLTNIASDFYPKCRTEKIKVVYIPIKNKLTGKYLNDLYVIKIIIIQGEVDRLYSITSKGFKSYMRLHGQCVELTSEEIEKNLIARRKGENLVKGINREEFEDTDINIPQISDTEEEPVTKLSRDKYLENRSKDILSTVGDSMASPLIKKGREFINLISYSERHVNKEQLNCKKRVFSSLDKCNSVKVSISNLNYDITKDDIIYLLKDYQFDSSIPIHIKKIQGFMVYALVHFNCVTDAIRVKQSLDGSELNNRKIQVKILSD